MSDVLRSYDELFPLWPKRKEDIRSTKAMVDSQCLVPGTSVGGMCLS
jgi:hypothetical protein